jgi:exopolyphosphatase/guanosine-5'-triphosphate,3'-diphosphate pyrophosphatase
MQGEPLAGNSGSGPSAAEGSGAGSSGSGLANAGKSGGSGFGAGGRALQGPNQHAPRKGKGRRQGKGRGGAFSFGGTASQGASASASASVSASAGASPSAGAGAGGAAGSGDRALVQGASDAATLAAASGVGLAARDGSGDTRSEAGHAAGTGGASASRGRRRRARGRPSGHFRNDAADGTGGKAAEGAGLRTGQAQAFAARGPGDGGSATEPAARGHADRRGASAVAGDAHARGGERQPQREARVPGAPARAPDNQLYAALDLGTNNCRLLIARPEERGFKVVDAFSRIVRLGEGVGASGLLSDAAMDRAIDALDNCQRKLVERGVSRFRLIATEACRAAGNGPDFIDRVRRETGLALEIVNRETEARLAVAGCATLVDRDAEGVLLFDIGGGSSEIVWLDLRNRGNARGYALTRFIRAWTSLPVGVVNLAERHGGMHVTHEIFEDMVDDVSEHLAGFAVGTALSEAIEAGQVHMLGTSGTVTTLAGVHFGLRRYDRRRVDGAWLADEDVSAMIEKLRGMSYEERIGNPCIGADRADLVLAGCAILEAIRRRWTCSRLRVADRGLREGILTELMAADGVWSRGSRSPRGQKGTT